MNRNSLLEISGRITHMAARITLNAADDLPMVQEMFFDGMNSDARNAVERIQSFGFTSMPLPRDPDDGKGGKAPGGGEQPKGPAAEGIALFIGGQRNHPVVIGMDDRRHRPMGLKPGENAQYDDQGQMTILRRTGLFLLSLDDAAAGAERMVSLRHVNKSPQAREKVGNRGSGGNAGSGRAVPLSAEAQAALNKAKADYKHEGDSVNTEVRCTKNRISFFAGSREVGYYDVEQDTWFFTAKVIHNQATEQVKDEAPRIDHN